MCVSGSFPTISKKKKSQEIYKRVPKVYVPLDEFSKLSDIFYQRKNKEMILDSVRITCIYNFLMVGVLRGGCIAKGSWKFL